MQKDKKVKIINKMNKNLPRLLVIRSNRYIYAQLINDKNGNIIATASSAIIKESAKPIEKAKKVGVKLAEMIKTKHKEIVFDRNKYLFHGKVKALAEGLRQGGIKF